MGAASRSPLTAAQEPNLTDFAFPDDIKTYFRIEPSQITPTTITAWILAFGLFRAFDIVKPWPIRDLDHSIRGGLGIMLDDLVAALYAVILLVLYGWLMT